jgi:type VI secretion system secreted protein VgrG
MNSFSADILVNGHVYLDAGGDPNAFFIVRGNKALTVADGAQVVLMNEAQDCGVFWKLNDAVTIGKTVDFHGTVIAGTAITMKTGSTLNGRALAQTAGVQLDANTVKAPSDSDCPHLQ